MKLLIIFFALSVSVVFGVEQIRQCSCDEQKLCFEQMVDEIEACMDECEISTEFETFLNESTNVGPCVEKQRKMVSNFYDCVHNECSLKDSCAKNNKSEEKVDMSDFEGLLQKFVRPIAEKSLKKFEEAAQGMNIPFVDAAMKMNKCTHECAFKKLENLKCFNKEKCTLKVTEDQVKQTFNQCTTKKVNGHKEIMEICECFQHNGIKNLAPFCEKLNKMKIPQEV